jgi:hypothetical protein
MASPGLFQWAFAAELDEGRGLRWRGLCKDLRFVRPRLGRRGDWGLLRRTIPTRVGKTLLSLRRGLVRKGPTLRAPLLRRRHGLSTLDRLPGNYPLFVMLNQNHLEGLK